MLFVGQFNEEKDLSSAFENPQRFYIRVRLLRVYPITFMRLIVSHRETNQKHGF